MIPALKGIRHFATTTTLTQAVSEFRMTVPWGEVRGQAWGPDQGRPVLCLHGWADNSGSFNRLIPLLPNALQWKRFSIIGHSMGGNVAGMFSALYPEMVESVVLLDSYGFLPTNMSRMVQLIKKGMDQHVMYDNEADDKKEKVYTYEKAKERLMSANRFLSDKSADILLERAVREVEGGLVFTRDFRIIMRNIVMITLEQSLFMLSLIQARVMLLMADQGLDNVFPVPDGFADDLRKGWMDQKGTIVCVEGDHHVHLNKPDSVAPIITDFLQSHRPDSTEMTLTAISLPNFNTLLSY
ncbi:serine hydrolase-like protein [Xyrauchen texanus]|uniref:serine hydrolase-like protein n=1 Tax=Xyrauchen texanus TaxID=154827 RepID=UPI00224291FC|nr:serine hydrolase-like protein [Xyrauchen texanus]XP_051983337.1 serine hydrolase-like protein [Xyrauchen texanus]